MTAIEACIFLIDLEIKCESKPALFHGLEVTVVL